MQVYNSIFVESSTLMITHVYSKDALQLQQKGHARNQYWQELYGFILQHLHTKPFLPI